MCNIEFKIHGDLLNFKMGGGGVTSLSLWEINQLIKD